MIGHGVRVYMTSACVIVYPFGLLSRCRGINRLKVGLINCVILIKLLCPIFLKMMPWFPQGWWKSILAHWSDYFVVWSFDSRECLQIGEAVGVGADDLEGHRITKEPTVQVPTAQPRRTAPAHRRFRPSPPPLPQKHPTKASNPRAPV